MAGQGGRRPRAPGHVELQQRRLQMRQPPGDWTSARPRPASQANTPLNRPSSALSNTARTRSLKLLQTACLAKARQLPHRHSRPACPQPQRTKAERRSGPDSRAGEIRRGRTSSLAPRSWLPADPAGHSTPCDEPLVLAVTGAQGPERPVGAMEVRRAHVGYVAAVRRPDWGKRISGKRQAAWPAVPSIPRRRDKHVALEMEALRDPYGLATEDDAAGRRGPVGLPVSHAASHQPQVFAVSSDGGDMATA